MRRIVSNLVCGYVFVALIGALFCFVLTFRDIPNLDTGALTSCLALGGFSFALVFWFSEPLTDHLFRGSLGLSPTLSSASGCAATTLVAGLALFLPSADPSTPGLNIATLAVASVMAFAAGYARPWISPGLGGSLETR